MEVATQQSAWVSGDGTVTEVPATQRDAEELVALTYEELGIKRIRPMKKWIFLRTDAVADRTPGGIILPLKKTRFYDGLPHLRLVTGVIIALGPNVYDCHIGMRVAFKRAPFAWQWKLKDGTYVGYIHERELAGEVEESWDVRPYD